MGSGYSWGGFLGAVAGGAFAGAIVGGIIGAGTGDPTFLGAVGFGMLGGASYSFAESPIRQLVDHGRVDSSQWGADVAIGGAVGAVTGGLGHLLRSPARYLAIRLGGQVRTRFGSTSTAIWLRDFEAGTLSETGRLGRLARLHNRLQKRYQWTRWDFKSPPYDKGRRAALKGRFEKELGRALPRNAELGHWAIPQGQWGKIVPNYIKNRLWNIHVMPNRLAHARLDLAIASDSITRFAPGLRQWFGMPA